MTLLTASLTGFRVSRRASSAAVDDTDPGAYSHDSTKRGRSRKLVPLEWVHLPLLPPPRDPRSSLLSFSGTHTRGSPSLLQGLSLTLQLCIPPFSFPEVPGFLAWMVWLYSARWTFSGLNLQVT